MLPKHHIIIGFITSAILYFLLPLTILEATIIFISSFLIDFDHYLLYIYKTRKLSPINSVKYFYKEKDKWSEIPFKEKKDYKRYLFIFHGIEAWIILAIISFYFPLVWFVLIGIGIHIFLDYIEIIRLKDPWHSKFSQFLVYKINKTKKSLPTLYHKN